MPPQPQWFVRAFFFPADNAVRGDELAVEVQTWLNSLPPTNLISVAFAPSTESSKLDLMLVAARETKA